MDIRQLKKFKRLYETPRGLIGYEDPIWYDGIAFYSDEKGNKYSRAGNPIAKDEMCKPGIIYQIIPHNEGPGRYDYSYQIIGARPDTIWCYEGWQYATLETIQRNRRHYHYCNLISTNQ